MARDDAPLILLVEDDRAIATVISAALEDEGFRVRHCFSIAERDAALAESGFAVMITDVLLEDGDGLASLAAVRREAPAMPVIVLSAQNTLDTAVRASDSEAFEYFPKPFDLDQLVQAVGKAAGATGARAGDRAAGAGEGEAPGADGEGLPLVGRSQAMQGVYRMIARVLRNDLTVLVTGESGTGKELVAEAIHQLGSRSTGPFVAVNTAAIPSDLIESELFGHEKGAFTGAIAQAIGKFEHANGGTLFLDEIGDMPSEAQTRLLRALQSGRIRRVGGRQEIAVSVRIIAATNRDLAPLIEQGAFREDLFYRLNVVPIQLPPLRDRREDIEVLAQHFLAQAVEDGLPRRRLSPDAIAALEARRWRGNVRELRNVVYRLALMARDEVIDAATLAEVVGPETAPPASAPASGTPDLAGALESWLASECPPDGLLHARAIAAFEKPLIEHALARTRGNQLRAAKLLGINRNTLRKRIVELAIEPERFARAV
ncbi:sigma-54 dependent transcriptional regulator [Erythrobacter sp. HL-111]|uniref:sigma 54-interacting transcriptional regulator n=1 Tax=Erythrobacter sp. HL-111 TaxID=1798193 RepID=UPI0006DB2049|nr:sigma-54 dependent transcriptional regulator [Erythrobacter sp. HL-111]KPP85447.1 MAG: two-component system, NtrC family, nitrogen regulation response regulator GlnG [Erythrobacteraceae bacterium HL-111]SDR97076.1 two-component system, NtrC family, nitrogen regulation response regulator GlnG [Erythrobacter sp. HL-111]